MNVKELKFLLKLLGKPNYQGKISQLKPTDKIKLAETEKICRELRDRKLVACSEGIGQIQITIAGTSLLDNLDPDELTVTTDELKILKACSKRPITPGKTKVKADKREQVIENLIRRGLIEVAASKIKQAWITDTGKEFLASEYIPNGGGNISFSKKMLADYLGFLRQYLRSPQSPVRTTARERVSNKIN